MPQIRLEHVTKRWGKFYGVDDLSLTIKDNAFVTLLGPSGCGKTTTLRMIAGLETPTSGKITIGDTVVFDSESGINVPANKRKVGFLFQNYALWPNMTVYQNISFGLSNIREDSEWLLNMVENLLTVTRINDSADNKVKKSSEVVEEVVSEAIQRLQKRLPDVRIRVSMPNDFYSEYPDVAGLRRCGFNSLDIWTYLSDDEIDWGAPLLDATREKAKKAGIGEIVWIREWWWHNARKEPDGMAELIDGKKVDSMLCLSYRGKWYQALIDQGKYLIDRGLYFHSTDPEMYGEGSKICFCESCKKRFGDYLKKKAADVAYEDPAIFEKNPEQYAELHRLWNAFKCWSYTEFFAEYRRAMEQYMKEKGIREPFRFMIYSSYHRSFPGFWQYEDYRKSHSYLMTLEDPQTFVGVFDFVAPMVYMDVYANYEDYDMLLPWRDTAVLRRITGDKVPIAPILCAGYPFLYAFGSDLNAI